MKTKKKNQDKLESEHILIVGVKEPRHPAGAIPQEIEDRLRRRYLDRLNLRLREIRKLLVSRNWEELRSECEQLASSGETFGFKELTQLAIQAQRSIPPGRVSRAMAPSSAKKNLEQLIAAIDNVLLENSVLRG